MSVKKYKLKLEVHGYDVIPFYGGVAMCLLVALLLPCYLPCTPGLVVYIALDMIALCFLVFCYSIQIN